MKLLYSETSPFVRKVRMFISILGMQDDIELELINPFENKELHKTNPLNKIPVLIDKDLTLIDSSLICEYLDYKHAEMGKSSLFCRGTDNYFRVQLLHTEANGILEAAVGNLLEGRREQAEQSEYWIARRYSALRGLIERLQPGDFLDEDGPHIGTISLASALGYLDFRFADYNWREWNNSLAKWFNGIEKQSWYLDTQPE